MQHVSHFGREGVDFSRYERGFVEAHRRCQERQLADLLLHIVAEEGRLTLRPHSGQARAALRAHCRERLDLRNVPTLRELGWGIGIGLEKQVVGALETLVEQGLVTNRDDLQVTEKGRVELGSQV